LFNIFLTDLVHWSTGVQILVGKRYIFPAQHAIQWVREGSSLGVHWLGHEADHSPPSNAEMQ